MLAQLFQQRLINVKVQRLAQPPAALAQYLPPCLDGASAEYLLNTTARQRECVRLRDALRGA